MGFEDKGQGFPKKLFLLLCVNHGRRGNRFKKNGGFDFELKKGHKKHFSKFFLDSGSFSNLEITMPKNKSEKIISSAPKTAATLITAATLNIASTVCVWVAFQEASWDFFFLTLIQIAWDINPKI